MVESERAARFSTFLALAPNESVARFLRRMKFAVEKPQRPRQGLPLQFANQRNRANFRHFRVAPIELRDGLRRVGFENPAPGDGIIAEHFHKLIQYGMLVCEL